jgi:arabinose-5-phosphate isomerase
MTKNPITISKDLLATQAVAIMNKKAITSLFVVDENGKIKGILHLHDCLRSGVM